LPTSFYSFLQGKYARRITGHLKTSKSEKTSAAPIAVGTFMIVANRIAPFLVITYGIALVPPLPGFEITPSDLK
jgi:hypothetical protein